jgi:hypothetical protein
MRRSTVLSLPLQLVFLAKTNIKLSRKFCFDGHLL